MGRPRVSEYGTEKTILKYFPYQGAPFLALESEGQTVGDRKIIKAGTPYPANNATCLGYVLEDVDVTDGDAAGTYVFEGSIDLAKAEASFGSTIDSAAKSATPRVTFF